MDEGTYFNSNTEERRECMKDLVVFFFTKSTMFRRIERTGNKSDRETQNEHADKWLLNMVLGYTMRICLLIRFFCLRSLNEDKLIQLMFYIIYYYYYYYIRNSFIYFIGQFIENVRREIWIKELIIV